MKHGSHGRLSLWLLLGLALPLSAAFLSSPGEAAASPEKPNRYIGASKCKNCHSAEETGDQHGKWSMERHAIAFETLASPRALEVGKEHGVAEPQKDAKCLQCHVTGHGEPEENIKKGFKFEEGVSCETCHGPGENHMKGRMAAAMSGEVTEGYAPPPEGEVISNPGTATCTKCHNESSPTYKPFCPQVYGQKIRHLNPQKPRTDEEKALLALTDPSKSPSCMECHKDG